MLLCYREQGFGIRSQNSFLCVSGFRSSWKGSESDFRFEDSHLGLERLELIEEILKREKGCLGTRLGPTENA